MCIQTFGCRHGGPGVKIGKPLYVTFEAVEISTLRTQPSGNLYIPVFLIRLVRTSGVSASLRVQPARSGLSLPGRIYHGMAGRERDRLPFVSSRSGRLALS